jgi:hypothetical protein
MLNPANSKDTALQTQVDAINSKTDHYEIGGINVFTTSLYQGQRLVLNVTPTGTPVLPRVTQVIFNHNGIINIDSLDSGGTSHRYTISPDS